MYKAEILADSLSPQGERLTTMKITFPRIMLAEFNTHRMFSRNSASSRAIPFKKIVKMVEENPFIPIAWQKDHKGMQGNEYWFSSDEVIIEPNVSRTFPHGVANITWLRARDKAIQEATYLNKTNITKQLCNRLLEPFMWHTVIVTATEWENFFKLRCPQYEVSNGFDINVYRSKKDAINKGKASIKNTDLEWLQGNKSQAEIHIQAIAELMWDAMNESTPLQLEAGEWHIPNLGHEWDNDKLLEITKGDLSKRTEARIKISTAHNARISYQTLGDNPKIDYEADIKLHDMLAESGHWSPFEHVAKAMSDEDYTDRFDKQEDGKLDLGWCRNFKGFIQYRYLVENNQTI